MPTEPYAHGGLCPVVPHLSLERLYKATGKGLSRNDIINLLLSLKKEYEWLTEPPSQCLQQVALDL